MTDNQPVEGVDGAKAWNATQDQKGVIKRLRIFALLSWTVAIGTEIAGVVTSSGFR